MARITLGSGITSINGKIGGTVYQNSASGTTAKNRGYRTNSNSAQSVNAKSKISYLNQSWSNLSALDKAAWYNIATYKPTTQNNNSGRFLNGQQMYLKYNYAYYTYFNTIISTPPFFPDVVVFRDLTVKNDAGSLVVYASDNIDESIQFVIFKISAVLRSGQSRAKGGVKFIPLTFGGGNTCYIDAAYPNLYGTIPAVGSFVEIEYQLFNVPNINWSNKVTQVIEVTTA